MGALPAFNCTSTSTINAILQAAKGIKNTAEKAAILGAIAGAQHVRLMAKHYGVPVVLHSDHCAKKLLPWFDGMLEADEAYFKQHGEPLFSSHMLDLSEEFDNENISTCVKYFKRMTAINQWLEMEIGITGGEEDGVNNENVDQEKLYTSPEQVWSGHEQLAPSDQCFPLLLLLETYMVFTKLETSPFNLKG